MPLIDRAGLVALYGEQEINQLAPDDNDGNARLGDAIERAQAEIDSRLAHRYQIPLPATTELVETAGVLVCARLYTHNPPEWITEAVTERRKYLDQAGQGKRALMGVPAKSPGQPTTGTVESLRGRRDRRFRRENMSDY